MAYRQSQPIWWSSWPQTKRRIALVLAIAVITLISIPTLGGAKSASAATPAFVQATSNSGDGTALTASYSQPVTAGDLLVGMFRTTAGTSVSDNMDGAWLKAVAASDGVNSLWYKPNAHGGATTVTVTASGSGAIRAAVAEYSGVVSSSALDSSTCNTGTSSTATTGNTGSVAAGDLAFAGVGSFTSPLTVSSGTSNGLTATLRNQLSGSNGTTADEDITSVSAGIQNASFRLSASTSWAACITTFYPAASSSTPTPTPSLNTIRPNTGAQYTDTSGNVWSADNGYSGGSKYTTTKSISNTANQPLYQTQRFGKTFSYSYRVVNGTYDVALQFAEVYWTTTGKRVFNVAINGATVLQNFDIVADAGSAFRADNKTFPVLVTNGAVTISFTTDVDNAEINSLAILPAVTISPTPTSTPTSSVTPTPTPTPTPSPTPTPTPMPQHGTLLSFGTPLGGSAYWHSLFLNCATYNSPDLTTFDVTATTPCWDSGDGTGTYRTDLCSSSGCKPNTPASESGGGWYQNGQDSCTSIPINIQADNTASIEPMFMEPKSYESNYPPWTLSLKDVGGTLEYYFGVLVNQSGPFTDAWMAPMTKGQWHTISVCEHAANTTSGKIYGLWLDGVKQTLMNNVPSTGFPTISPADTSIPIDINAYGNSVDARFVFLHGAPIIELNDTNSPPEPSWGWTGSPPTT